MQSYAPLCKPVKIQTPTLEYTAAGVVTLAKEYWLTYESHEWAPPPAAREPQMGTFCLLFFTRAARARITFFSGTFLHHFACSRMLKFHVVSSTPSRKVIASLHARSCIAGVLSLFFFPRSFLPHISVPRVFAVHRFEYIRNNGKNTLFAKARTRNVASKNIIVL